MLQNSVRNFKLLKLLQVILGSVLLTVCFNNDLSAHMIPFAFWKPGICSFSANTTVTSANVANYSNCIWDIPAGVTVTVNYTSFIQITGLKIANTGVLTHRGCSTTICTPLRMTINGDVTIASGGRINLDGLGYLGSYQSGPDAVANSSTSGQTYGNTTTGGAGSTAGGSHGGWGGWNSAVSANKPSLPYGVIKYPDTFGSGGGGISSTYKGGNGGGATQLNISGTLTLNGNGTTPPISANGADGNCGAGAGGSIYITAKNITSSTSGLLISANGGIGGTSATCVGGNHSGGGGGGHIAIEYTSGISGTFAINSTYIRAYGGTQATPTVGYYGGSGTISVGTPSSSSGDLYVYGPNNTTYTYNGTPIGAFGWVSSVTATTITFVNYTSQVVAGQYVGLIAPDVDAITLSPQTLTGSTATTITNASADLTTLTSVGKMWAIYDTRYSLWDNINISDASIVHSGYLFVNSTTTISNTAKLVTANLTSPTVNLNDTSILSHFPSDVDYVGRLKVSATNMTIATGASVNADGLGYLGGKKSAARGSNSSKLGMTLNFTTNGGADQDAGGSHGGIGGYDDDPSYKTYYPGAAYDSISTPIEAGGGGGTTDGTAPYDAGGNGGGVVYISATGTLTINGIISAKGGSYVSTAGGGGAGGSIYLNVGTLTSASAGTSLTVEGGSGAFESGGGGRISISYTTLSGTFSLSSTKITANGGTAALDGSAGTIFSYANGVSSYGKLHIFDDSYSDFRGTVFSPYGLITSSTATTITDSSLVTNGRDFIVTKAQVVGKTMVVNHHLTTPSTFTITDYDPATGVFTVSGGSAAGLTANTYWYITGFNTQYDNVILGGSTYIRTPYLSATTMTSSVSETPTLEIFRIDAGTINLTNGSPTLTAWGSNGTLAPQPLVIAATTFTLGASAKVDLRGAGYLGGNKVANRYMGREGWANNNTNYGYTSGNTTTGGSTMYTGGSGAGYGGFYAGSSIATPFGDPAQPFTFGSGGGGNTGSSTAIGGNGGGVVKIDVSGTLTVTGQINASGEYITASGASGAGGGGSIWITAGTISSASASNERIIAYGGYVTNSSAHASACGGGGGKLALYYTAYGGTFDAGKVGANGGPGNSGNGCNGGAGLEYYKKTSDTYPSIFAWNGSVPNYLPTPLPAYNMSLGNLETYSGASLKQMSNTNTITVHNWLGIENAAGAAIYVPNDESNDGSYNNALPVGTWFIAPGGGGTITEY